MPLINGTGPRAVCPEDRTPLTLADAQLLSSVNSAIAAGLLRNRAGELVERPLDAGLLRADGKFLYPVVDTIPKLLSQEAIPTEQPCLSAALKG